MKIKQPIFMIVMLISTLSRAFFFTEIVNKSIIKPIAIMGILCCLQRIQTWGNTYVRIEARAVGVSTNL